MYSHGDPRRRSWARRHRIRLILLAVAAVLIVAGITRAIPSGPSGHDYRDPAQLAEAMKNTEGSATAYCSKIGGNRFICAVGFTDGTAGSYQVTVTADGSSYAVS